MRITGSLASGFHVVNILLHCLSTYLFVKLCELVLRDKLAILLSGCMFASHPIHTEAVAGIVGRADVAATIFCLLSFLSYRKHIRFRDSSQFKCQLYLSISLMLATLSVLCKEYGITVLLISALYDIYLHSNFKLRKIYSLFFKVSTISVAGIML